jgi:hypothetical protein
MAGGGGALLSFTMHRLGEKLYVTFSFLDTLCVIFEIPISIYSYISLFLSLSAILHSSRICRLGKTWKFSNTRYQA